MSEETLEEILDAIPSDGGLSSVPVETEPDMHDPAWSEFVMRHFEGGELDPDGRPMVHGLRRVARQLLGPILESESTILQAPAFVPGSDLLQPAVARHTVKLLMTRLEQGMGAAYPVVYSDVADVYHANTDPMFVRFATATAATRAEARCLRKLLGLKGASAEEMTALPIEESGANGKITPTQLTFLNVLCKRCDVNALKFINAGKNRYDCPQDIPYSSAVKMMEVLSGFQTDPSKIPPNLTGYEKNWQN